MEAIPAVWSKRAVDFSLLSGLYYSTPLVLKEMTGCTQLRAWILKSISSQKLQYFSPLTFSHIKTVWTLSSWFHLSSREAPVIQLPKMLSRVAMIDNLKRGNRKLFCTPKYVWFQNVSFQLNIYSDTKCLSSYSLKYNLAGVTYQYQSVTLFHYFDI